MKFVIDFSDSDSDSDFELPRRPSFVARGLSSLRRSCRRVTRSMAKISFTKAGFQSFLRLELAFISKNLLRLLLNGTKLIQWTQFSATETISFNKMNSLKPSTRDRWTRVSAVCPRHVRVRDFLKKPCPCPRSLLIE